MVEAAADAAEVVVPPLQVEPVELGVGVRVVVRLEKDAACLDAVRGELGDGRLLERLARSDPVGGALATVAAGVPEQEARADLVALAAVGQVDRVGAEAVLQEVAGPPAQIRVLPGEVAGRVVGHVRARGIGALGGGEDAAHLAIGGAEARERMLSFHGQLAHLSNQ